MLLPENLWGICFNNGESELSYSPEMIKWLDECITNYKLNVKTSMITETIEDDRKNFKVIINVEIEIPNKKEMKLFHTKWY